MKKIILFLIMVVCIFKANAQPSFGKIEGLVKIILDYPLMKMDFTTEQLEAWRYKVDGYHKEITKEMDKIDPNIQVDEEFSEALKKRADKLTEEYDRLREELIELYVKAHEESGVSGFTMPTTPQEVQAQITKAYNVLSRYISPQTGEIAKYHAKLRAFIYEKWIPFTKSIESTYKYSALGAISLASISGVYNNYAVIMQQYISARDGYKSLNE